MSKHPALLPVMRGWFRFHHFGGPATSVRCDSPNAGASTGSPPAPAIRRDARPPTHTSLRPSPACRAVHPPPGHCSATPSRSDRRSRCSLRSPDEGVHDRWTPRSRCLDPRWSMHLPHPPPPSHASRSDRTRPRSRPAATGPTPGELRARGHSDAASSTAEESFGASSCSTDGAGRSVARGPGCRRE